MKDIDNQRITEVLYSDTEESIQSLAASWDPDFSERRRYGLIQLMGPQNEVCAIESTRERAISLRKLLEKAVTVKDAKQLLAKEKNKNFLLTCGDKKKATKEMSAKKSKIVNDTDFDEVLELKGV